MRDHVRAENTFIPGRLISGRRASAVYDYFRSKHVMMSGTIDARSVSVYDFDYTTLLSRMNKWGLKKPS